mgnify:CR=1 FL=1
MKLNLKIDQQLIRARIQVVCCKLLHLNAANLRVNFIILQTKNYQLPNQTISYSLVNNQLLLSFMRTQTRVRSNYSLKVLSQRIALSSALIKF